MGPDQYAQPQPSSFANLFRSRIGKNSVTKMKKIFNSEVLAVKDYETFSRSPYPNSDFSIGRKVKQSLIYRNFIENLLLYDQVLILTNSFEELMTIKNWVGGPNVVELLHAKAIEFIQTPFAWTYIQKWKFEQGHRSFYGIANVFIADERSVSLPSGRGTPVEAGLGGWSNSDLEQAISYTLTKFHDHNPKKVGKLARLVAEHSRQLNSDQLRGNITNKTHQDLMNLDLRKSLGFSENIDVENIPDNSEDIRRLFRLLLANQTVEVLRNIEKTDILAEEFYTSVLSDILDEELNKYKKARRASRELFSLEGIPVPTMLGFKSRMTAKDIIDLRNSKNGENFRKWFHEKRRSSDDIKSAYVELLKAEQNLPWMWRIIGSIAPAAIAAITKLPSVAEIATGTSKDLFVDPLVRKFLRPNPPRLFMEKMKNNIKEKERINIL